LPSLFVPAVVHQLLKQPPLGLQQAGRVFAGILFNGPLIGVLCPTITAGFHGVSGLLFKVFRRDCVYGVFGLFLSLVHHLKFSLKKDGGKWRISN
jgi:hypothetical protein